MWSVALVWLNTQRLYSFKENSFKNIFFFGKYFFQSICMNSFFRLGSSWQEMPGAVCTLMRHWGHFPARYSFLRAGSWGRLHLFQALEYLQGCYFCLILLRYRTSVSACWSTWGPARVSTKDNSTHRPWVWLAPFGCNISDEVFGIGGELELNTTLRRRRKRGGGKSRKQKNNSSSIN